MTTKPSYQHDCDTCKFLGQTIGGGKLVDLYVHESPTSNLLTTLIARYGNDGPEYYSSHPGYCHPNGHAELWAAQSIYMQGDKAWPKETL